MLTPLSTTSAQQDGDDEFNIFAFDRLTAPKFGVVRTPQTRAETELYLKKQEDSMTRLKIVDRDCSGEEAGYDSGVEMGQSDEVTCMRLFNEGTSSSVGRGKAAAHAAGLSLVTKKSLVKEEEVVESMSPGGHINKRRARSRPVSQELLSAANTPAFKSTQVRCLLLLYVSQLNLPMFSEIRRHISYECQQDYRFHRVPLKF